MKKNVFLIAVLAVVMLFSNKISAQKFSGLDKSPMDIASFPISHRVSDKDIKVVYSRPQLKGRKLSKLAQAGKVWRLGANEATEVTFYKNVMFGGKSVKAGTYAMFAIPGAKEWTIILNKDLNVWGHYSHKESQDVVRVQAKVSSSAESIEAFSISFDDNMNLYLGWENTIVKVTIK